MRRSPLPSSRPVIATLVLLLVCTASACGTADSASAEGPPGTVDLDALDGTAWVSAGPDDLTGAPIRIRPGTRLSLDFDGTRVGASADCNGMGGEAEIVDGRLQIAEGLAMTEMACPGLMEQEQWYADFLMSAPTIEVDGDTLTLAGGGATLALTDRSVIDGPDALEGVRWRLDSVTRTRGETASGSGASWYRRATLRLADGAVHGRSGCNSYRAEAEVDGDRLVTGPVAATRKACARPRMRLERTFQRVLASDPTWAVDGETLTLATPDGGTGLQFSAAGAR